MKCPHCGNTKDRVLESRTNSDSSTIRRRRECTGCGYRFTSYEKIESKPLMVLKKDGKKQPFNEDKLARSIQVCTEKLGLPPEDIYKIVSDVEEKLNLKAGNTREVASSSIGDVTLHCLKDYNEVAYIRFAAVYRNFTNVDQFIKEIKNLR